MLGPAILALSRCAERATNALALAHLMKSISTPWQAVRPWLTHACSSGLHRVRIFRPEPLGLVALKASLFHNGMQHDTMQV